MIFPAIVICVCLNCWLVRGQSLFRGEDVNDLDFAILRIAVSPVACKEYKVPSEDHNDGSRLRAAPSIGKAATLKREIGPRHPKI